MNPAFMQLFCKHKRPHAVLQICLSESDWPLLPSALSHSQSALVKQNTSFAGKRTFQGA